MSNALDDELGSFAQDLIDTASATLGTPVGFTIDVGPEKNDNLNVVIRQSDIDGIPLAIDGETLFRVIARYRCTWSSQQQYLAVGESSFTLRVEGSNEPVLHFDYARDANASVPVAHINVHAHRDELVYAMMRGSGNRAKHRARKSNAGTVPRIASLHIPVGGHRFRPCLEDVLEMCIQEFGIDAAQDALQTLRASRARFRSMQVSAAVSDDPDAAAAALKELGYDVRAPEPSPRSRADRLSRY